MTVSTENAAPGLVRSSGSSRPVQEVSVAALFGPLADLLVRALLPLRIPPPAVVLAHAALGLAAALAVYEGSPILAAVLLQVKTLLDNADGRLARASGRVTLVGRYLDTEVDFVVNGALFVALASVTGAPWLALAAFCSLTLLLSVDFNEAELHRLARGWTVEQPSRTGARAEPVLERAYAVVFAPQDRLVRSASARRLARARAGETDPERRLAAELAYHDRATATVLANLGLSTQLLVLAVLLVLGAVFAYLWAVVAALGLLPILQLRRERHARQALAR